MDFLSIFVFFYISTFLHLRRAFTLFALSRPSSLQSCRKRKTSIDLENDIRRQDKERLEVKIQ